MYVIRCDADKVVVSDWLHNETTITSVEQFHAFMNNEADRLNRQVEDLDVYNSSTMDFPHDSTSNPEVLALVAALNEDSMKY